ncbi:hypothetical protein SAMN05414139_10366 [Burkholderia sp. D7]|nr:hypothetical protein SAMN05414139_10366 [Burkholderia sp. D7]
MALSGTFRLTADALDHGALHRNPNTAMTRNSAHALCRSSRTRREEQVWSRVSFALRGVARYPVSISAWETRSTAPEPADESCHLTDTQ